MKYHDLDRLSAWATCLRDFGAITMEYDCRFHDKAEWRDTLARLCAWHNLGFVRVSEGNRVTLGSRDAIRRYMTAADYPLPAFLRE